jgi:hypothetical protein
VENIMIRLCAFSDEAGSSLKEQIDALKRNNISLMELRSIDKKNVADFTIEEAKNIKKKWKKIVYLFGQLVLRLEK